MTEVSTEKRSFFAMLLSLVLPGLGQIYLRKPLKGLFLFVGVASAAAIIYMNSLPVNNWRDLIRLEGLAGQPEKSTEAQGTDLSAQQEEEKNLHYHVFTLNEGSKLTWLYRLRWPHAKVGDEVKFRVYWQFKVTGLIQGLVFWVYAVYDGWRGQRGFNKRAFKKKLKSVQKRRRAKVVKV